MSQSILVVEDEPASLRVLSYFLNQQGYQALGARDGVEAMELLDQFRFDLVLSDLKMPRMNGVALTRQLLSNVPITPVILMTACIIEDYKEVLDLGIPCLRKPFLLDELRSTIQTVLSYARPLAAALFFCMGFSQIRSL
jgi:DNA-binding response OmpR family regulator